MSHDEGLTPSPAMDGASSHVSWGRATGVTSVVIDASDMRRESVMRDLLRVVLSGRDRKWLVRSSGTSTSRSLPHVLTLVLEPYLDTTRAHVQAFCQLGTLLSRRESCPLPHLVENLQLIRIGPAALLLDSRLLRAQ